TLAMGVDLPARRVVIRDLNRFDVNYGLTPIPVLEVKQMCGRAGRPRYDPYGEAILFAKELDDVDELMEEYFRSPPEAIDSKLAMGVDLPARRVVIRDLNRFDVNYGLTPIPVLEVKQMCGRAGRPRYDPYGEAILFAKELDDVDELMEEYFRSPPEAIDSKL